MQRKTVLGFVFLLMQAGAWSQKIKDTLFFNNGTIVIGEVKRIKLGVITFDPDDANDITVQLGKLKTLAASSKVFRIETVEHVVYFGVMLPSSQPNSAIMLQGTDSIPLRLPDISVLYPFERSIGQRFSGNASLGYSYTRSSDFGRLNYSANLGYVSRKEEITISTSGIYTIEDSSFSRDREDLFLKNNYYFSPTWFGTIFFSYQRNLELGLLRRYQEGIGAGNKFITKKRVYAWARTGVVFNQEKSTEGESSGTLEELFLQLEFNFFRFTKPEINVIMTQSIYYSLSQKNRFRNDGETDINWEIFDDFYLNLGCYTNYDSKSPGSNASQFDFGIVFGIKYSF